MTYHKDQLNKLIDVEFNKSVVVFDGSGNKTKQMDINLESIPILIEFLKKEEKRLKLLENKTE